ncbi:Hpt domain-containing protein [Planktotalea sp.]|uniref:Hpt domain-containing protein n=1 Tax=Planktotalea sp. TaxID=2029877 RepID=UPI0025E78AAC|nr:Hpt domain-containing protein [Planktotalea sp.]
MINWARIIEVSEEIGLDDFDEVVELFLIEVEKRLAILLSKEDHKSVEEDLHFLKGSALNLGFSDLAAICHEGEGRAAKGESVIDRHYIISVYNSSKAEFLESLAGKIAA